MICGRLPALRRSRIRSQVATEGNTLVEQKPYDPRLREAAEEFKALCKKYDCTGTVLFCSPTHAEFVTHLEASWSVITLQDGKHRVRSRLEDFGGDRKAQHEATECTVHALTSIVEWSRQTNEVYRAILSELGKYVRVMWTAWDKPASVPGDGK